MMVANLGAAQAREIGLGVIRACAGGAVCLFVIDPAHFEMVAKGVPCASFVGMIERPCYPSSRHDRPYEAVTGANGRRRMYANFRSRSSEPRVAKKLTLMEPSRYQKRVDGKEPART